MADFKPIVALTNVNVPSLSRNDLIGWVNSKVDGNYTKIEQLCSGVAYCQMMEQLFPNCIGLKKVKKAAKLEYEQLHNLRLLQNAFTRLKFDKCIPMDRLVKGRFQDNLEFLQWFKKFYDSSSNFDSKENIPNNMPKPKLGAKKNSNPMLNSKKIQKKRSVSPTIVSDMEEKRDTLQAQVDKCRGEKDFYFKKLLAVETMLKRARERGEGGEFCEKVSKVLFAKENDSEEY